jgi:hypothetical protein
MHADELLDLVVGNLTVLKGFPRNDAGAVLKVAEILLSIVKPKTQTVPDSELYRRAEAIVRRVINIAPEGWEGPAQLFAASSKLAEEAEHWQVPEQWKREATPVQCSKCLDIGVVGPDKERKIQFCDCPAGETPEARKQLENLQRIAEESRKFAERARQSRVRQLRPDVHNRIREAISE